MTRPMMGRALGWVGAGISLAVILLLWACLPPPPLPTRDGGNDAPAPALSVTAVEVRAYDGRSFPLLAAPRRPWIEVSLTRELDDAAVVMLLVGPPDAGLEEDLRESPLRAEHTRRVVECDLHRALGRIELSPRTALAPGTELTLIVPAWASSGRDRLGTPVLTALQVSVAAEGGAAVTAAWPPDGASDVGTLLERVVLRFDGGLLGLDGVALFDGDSRVSVEAAPFSCPRLGLDGTCVSLTPRAALAPLTNYRLQVDGARDLTSAPVPVFSSSFRTGSGPDRNAPQLVPIPCAFDERVMEASVASDGAIIVGCSLTTDERVVVRIEASEPVVASAAIASTQHIMFAPRGAARFEARGLLPSTVVPVALSVLDTGGIRSSYALELETVARLPRVGIVEVRADPRGREPAQEFVELLNADSIAVDLEGFTLSDAADREGDILPTYSLAPGARVLVVADSFDPDDPRDEPPVPPGARLLRIGTAIGVSGLSSTGEPLFLRDAGGHRLSAVPAIAAPEPGACLARAGPDLANEDPSYFIYSLEACSPGVE